MPRSPSTRRCGGRTSPHREGPCRHAGPRRASFRRGCGAIAGGLDKVAAEYEANGVPEDWDLEDIHMTTESRLAELIGPAAGRLHTARSRNDQVATDFRLWVRDAMDQADAGLLALQRALVTRAGEHADSDHARLHPSADRAAGDARPSPDGLLRDGARDRSRFADARARMNRARWARRRWPAPAFRSTASDRAGAGL
jgi:hypothetical protein